MLEENEALPLRCSRRQTVSTCNLTIAKARRAGLVVLSIVAIAIVVILDGKSGNTPHLRSKEQIIPDQSNLPHHALGGVLSFEEEFRIRRSNDQVHKYYRRRLVALPPWASYVVIVVLTLFSALFSGLTLGLLGLDITGLEIVMNGDDPIAAKQAKKIAPVRANGNLLLCTLILGNVAVNSLLSIIMADIAGGLVGFFVSTAVTVVFGEIIPQAVCSRYALAIGSRVVPIVKILICLLCPAAFPLAWMLNKALGHELGTIYSKAEFVRLLEIHAERGGFNKEMTTAMTGALKYQDLTVSEIMTPWEKVFTLSIDENLSYDTVVAIFKAGYSRIPIYEGKHRSNVIGLLFVKDLIFIDPDDEIPLRNFVRIFGRGVHVVWPDDKLGDVLRELKQGKSHMALVRDVNNADENQDPFYEIKGIITLEDIVEVILGDEILDETDVFTDELHNVKVQRTDFEWDKLRLLDSKIIDKTLNPAEQKAVTAYLRTHYSDTFSSLTDRQLEILVSTTFLTEIADPKEKHKDNQQGKSDKDDKDTEGVLYTKGEHSEICTLILSGKVTVHAGSDLFRSDLGPWSVLGTNALLNADYVPDFSASVSAGPCRLLQFSRSAFVMAVDASTAERIMDKPLGTEKRPSVTDSGMNNCVPSEPPVAERADRRGKLLAAFQRRISSNEESDSPTEVVSKHSSSNLLSAKKSDATALKESNGKLTNGESLAPQKRNMNAKNSVRKSDKSFDESIEYIKADFD